MKALCPERPPHAPVQGRICLTTRLMRAKKGGLHRGKPDQQHPYSFMQALNAAVSAEPPR